MFTFDPPKYQLDFSIRKVTVEENPSIFTVLKGDETQNKKKHTLL